MTRIETAFDDEQFANPYPDGIQNHYWTAARNRMIERAIRHVVPAQTALLLDIGCGRGITVDYLRRKGLRAIGCEIASPTPISASVAEYLHLAADAFELEAALRSEVELLMLLDVLEHLPEPRRFLRECFERFKNAKYILLTVPACMELWSNYDVYYQHFLRYDMDSLRSLGTDETYALHQAGYFFHGLYIPAWLLKFVQRDRAVTIRAPSRSALSLHRFLANCFEWEQRLLPSRLPGTSLMAVLRRVESRS